MTLKSIEFHMSTIRNDGVLYSIIIDSLCKDRLVTEALNFLYEMMSKGIQPNLVTYNSLIQGLCNFGRWSEAKTLLNEMVQRKIMPDVHIFSILVDSKRH
jgi:pentatricopeptide repeat protein